jgi:hypothetical protein
MHTRPEEAFKTWEMTQLPMMTEMRPFAPSRWPCGVQMISELQHVSIRVHFGDRWSIKA